MSINDFLKFVAIIFRNDFILFITMILLEMIFKNLIKDFCTSINDLTLIFFISNNDFFVTIFIYF